MIEDMSDAIAMLSSGSYVVTRQAESKFVAGVAVQPVTALPWRPEQTYATGARVAWPFGPGIAGDVFEAVQEGAGVSSVDQPPSGEADGQVDGTCVWNWVARANQEPFTIVASLQPLSGREMDRLPELLRTREVQSLWTTTPLVAAQEDTQGDIVTIKGVSWEVHNFADWQDLGRYTRVLLARSGR